MRKRHPRIVRDPMDCIRRRLPLPAEQNRDIGIAYFASMQAMRCGRGTEQAWATIACTLNTAMLLAEKNHEADTLITIKSAQRAHIRAYERAQRTGKWAFDGDAIHIIEDALNIHDDQLSREPKGKISAALNEVHRRVEAGETLHVHL